MRSGKVPSRSRVTLIDAPPSHLPRRPIMKRLLAVLTAVAIVAAALAIPALAATRTITVGDNFFKPASVTVAKGTTVKWVWKGKIAHNVTVKTGPVKFKSATMPKGTYSKRLTRKGTYAIVCTIHPGMKMTLKVR
jgi:plastocyanin